MEDEATWSHKQTVSRTRGLHEKSYPCHDQANSFPVARNVHERNGERGSGPVMRGEKRGKIRPVGTISREVMRDLVYAGTLNEVGALEVHATRVGTETTLGQIR